MEEKKFAVFDIDGTLIRWQLYHSVVDRLAKKGYLGGGDYQKIHQARMKWKRREHKESFSDYEQVVVRTYEKALKNLSVIDFENIASETAREYKEQIYVYTKELAKNLKSEGYTLLAISGSHTELVQAVAREYGFDDWVGTVYARAGGRFTGEKTIGKTNKQEILKKLIKKHKLSLDGSYGVGDSLSDASFLKVVEYPIAFNPDKQLFEVAKSNHWPIVLERKNMVYQLKYIKDGYVLEKAG